jgi:hypothetical protein
MGLFDFITAALGALGGKRAEEKRDAKAEEVKEESVKYQAYLDERKTLVEGEQKSVAHFDSTILTLAAGALGVSLVFIEKIAPEPLPRTLWLLYGAWGAYAGSLLVILISFLTSGRAFRRQRKILEDTFWPDVRLNADVRNGWTVATRFLNIGSVVIFFIGTCFLVQFSVTNLAHKVRLGATMAASAPLTNVVAITNTPALTNVPPKQ